MMATAQLFLSGDALSWMPNIMLIFLLAWAPWRHYAPSGSWGEVLHLSNTAVVMCGLIVPGAAAWPGLWLAIAAGHFMWIVFAYHRADNHQYLIGYWCVVLWVGLSAGGAAGAAVLQTNGSLLIGLCFGFAVLTKVLNRRYRDGSMFGYLLTNDRRFLAMANLVGGVSPDECEQHRVAANLVRSGRAATAVAPTPPRLRRFATALTWWTVAIEAIVAWVFLVPMDIPDVVRISVLAAFALTTYLLVAVPSFGQILILMAMATVSDSALRMYLLLAALSLTVLTCVPQHIRRVAVGRHHLMRLRGASALAQNDSGHGATTSPQIQ